MEILSCTDCKGVVCIDLEKGVRAIGNYHDNQAVRFPENVRGCAKRIRRVSLDLKQAEKIVEGLYEGMGDQPV
jgi:hypothetical protein